MKSALGRPEVEETEAGGVAEDAQVPFRHQGVQVTHSPQLIWVKGSHC
jgi:hypothetical protein